MRTRDGDILSVACIIELMQLFGYGKIAPDILDRRENERGCEPVPSLAEPRRDGTGQ
jgi:hypothetical protein